MKLKELELIVAELQKAFVTHLTESGEIRTDLKTCKTSIERIEGRMWALATSSILTLLAVCGYLLKVSLWK